jgi:hypothetical protein
MLFHTFDIASLLHLLHLLLLIVLLITILLTLQKVRRGVQLSAAIDPDPAQLPLNNLSPDPPLLHIGQAVSQLGQLALDAQLLLLRADAVKLPLGAIGAHAQREGEGVVFLQRGARRDGDQRNAAFFGRLVEKAFDVRRYGRGGFVEEGVARFLQRRMVSD